MGISNEGARYFAEALEKGSVRHVIFVLILYSSSYFNIETYNTHSREQFNQRRRNSTFGSCTRKQHGEQYFYLFHYYISVQTLIDLNLRDNETEDQGAECLVRVLEKNTVRNVIFYFTIC
jgi:hypothetical protein